MKLYGESFPDRGEIPAEYAFCVFDAQGKMAFGSNHNPHLAWEQVPQSAKSLILLCIDPDVPAKPAASTDLNRVIPVDVPRINFFHWVMVDVEPAMGGIVAGSCSDGVVPRGKRNPSGPKGSRQGVNDYTRFTSNDPEMAGIYRGYDGPCPPSSDERIHHYYFRLYAMDFSLCPVEGDFTGADVIQAIRGHVLAESEWTGLYSLNLAIQDGLR